MKIREIISMIRNGSKDYSRTQDYPDGYLWQEFVNKRALYFSRKLKKFEYINPQNYQMFCFPLIDSNLNECSTLLDVSCDVKRTVNKIPPVISGRNNINMVVMNIFNGAISRTELNELDINQFNDIKKNSVKWFLSNGYVYVCNNKDIELIKIVAIWDDIKDLDSNVTQCSSYLDVDFNIDNETLDIVISMVLEKLIPSKQIIEDNTADGNNTIK